MSCTSVQLKYKINSDMIKFSSSFQRFFVGFFFLLGSVSFSQLVDNEHNIIPHPKK